MPGELLKSRVLLFFLIKKAQNARSESQQRLTLCILCFVLSLGIEPKSWEPQSHVLSTELRKLVSGKKIRYKAEFFCAEEERFELSEPVKVQQFSRLSY